MTCDRFVTYQRQLAAVLDDFARMDGWVSLDVNDKSVPAVAEALAAIVRRHLQLPALPADIATKAVL